MRDRVLIILSALVLQGCTIAYYDLKNELDRAPTSKAICDVKYSINVTTNHYANFLGFREDKEVRLQAERDKYVADTRDVLNNKGCKATNVEKEDEATLEVRIVRVVDYHARPQQWLTGLSLGLIPSWATMKSEYTYFFKEKSTGKSHTYTVDLKTYNHLILFPVYWINLFTLDENRVYKNALTNFLEHS